MSEAVDNVRALPGVEFEAFPKRPSRFVLEDFDTLEPGEALERVKGLWPRSGLCFVGGPSMSGKSFWTLDALAKVCRGEPVLGRKSVPAGTLYIAAEGAHGVRKRIKALRSKIGELGGAFQFIGQAPNLRDADDVADLSAVIEQAREGMTERGFELGVVAIDTLSASIPGADENSAADMSPVLHALQTMAAEKGLLVLMIAHTGKDETRGLRGWSGLLANADGLIMLESPEGATRVGSVVKVKDGESGDRFAFELRRVVLGHDSDGDEISSCVIEETDAPSGSKAGRKPTKADEAGNLILTAFNRLIMDRPQRVFAEGAEGVQAVTLNDLRALSYEIGVGGGEAEVPADATEAEAKASRQRWQESRKKAFARAFERLLASRVLRTEKGMVWDFNAKVGGAQ